MIDLYQLLIWGSVGTLVVWISFVLSFALYLKTLTNYKYAAGLKFILNKTKYDRPLQFVLFLLAIISYSIILIYQYGQSI